MVTSSFWKFDQDLIHIRRGGNRGGEPLLMIHGNCMDSRAFEAQYHGILAETHDLVAFDLPGCGESFRSLTPETDYRFVNLATWIPRVSNLLWPGRRPAIIGYSLGGHLTVQCLKQGFLPHAIIFLGYAPLAHLGAMERYLNPVDGLDHIFREDWTDDVPGFYAGLMTDTRGECYQRASESLRRADARIRRYLAPSFSEVEPVEEDQAIRDSGVRFEAFLGTEDKVVNREYFLAPHFPGWSGQALRLIPGAGHIPQGEQPEVFDRLVAEFLQAPLVP